MLGTRRVALGLGPVLVALAGCATERAAGSTLPARTTPTVVERLASEPSRAYELAATLAGEIGPRLTSSTRLERAETWALERFSELGLAARIETWGHFAVGFDRGPSHVRVTVPEPRELPFSAPAWSAGTRGPRSAELRLVASEEEIDVDLAGRFVLLAPGGEGRRRGERRRLERALARAEVAGILSRGPTPLKTTGRYAPDGGSLSVPNVRLAPADFDELAERCAAGERVRLEIDLDHRFRRGPIAGRNVVADLVGTERPDEFVIVGAHLDSWDEGEGANDNAAGVATTLDAARLLVRAGARPKRTIRFVLFTGEEQGLLGSQGYVRDHADELDSISAVLVQDLGTGRIVGLPTTAALRPDLERATAAVLGLDPDVPFRLHQRRALPENGASDHTPFARAGVPAFFWRQRGGEAYRAVHHTRADVLATLDPEALAYSSRVVALTALGIAELDRLLPRAGADEPDGDE